MNANMKQLKINDEIYNYCDIKDIKGVQSLPYSLKILLENIIRNVADDTEKQQSIQAIIQREKKEIQFNPARIILQDFTGVPALVDLAAMRDAMKSLGEDTSKINPLRPVELVIDHSVQVDYSGTQNAFKQNTELDYQRNRERYKFLKWGQKAFDNFTVIPPGVGIIHQVNLEYLARCVFEDDGNLYPDTVVGTDSHTTMINGIGVLGWGVGGIEAEAAMLGQSIPMLIPSVVGFKLTGTLQEGVTATDLVLTVTQMLREFGVVGKFVEFYGNGISNLSVADRATISNMAPEYGATCGVFPVDESTIDFLRLTARSEKRLNFITEYYKAQGMFGAEQGNSATYDEHIELDISSVIPSLAGPKRPQDRIPLNELKQTVETLITPKTVKITDDYSISNGSIAIAAITSCTNTSNPYLMIAAGLVAKKAVEKGIKINPYVKTAFAPGSQVVTKYLESADLNQYLDQIGFNVVGYGCTVCIGNSGPLNPEVTQAIQDNELNVASVLSGNRNFEGRIHPEVKMNFLASPPLVVVYALAGRVDIDLYHDPIAQIEGKNIYMKDIWPTNDEINEQIKSSLSSTDFKETYAKAIQGDEHWQAIQIEGNEDIYTWDPNSSYIQKPNFVDNINKEAQVINDIKDARTLAYFGDSITTDHISPAGTINEDSPAGKFLIKLGLSKADFNSYGARRGNHFVMNRGTFANIRIKNKMLPKIEGGYSIHIPSQKIDSIFDVAKQYQESNIPTIILAGKEYGTGSSRDWAAKGPYLQGVKAVIAESYERIHRSNLVGMGILPLQFQQNQNAELLGLDGFETYHISGIDSGKSKIANVKAIKDDGSCIEFEANIRIDTEKEQNYFIYGNILKYVLLQLAS